MNAILKRIENEAGIPGLAEILAERLAPTDLQSLLLEVYRLRAGRLSPADVLRAYGEDRFVRPAGPQPECLNRWEQTALAELPPGFEALALAPLCPLGTSSAVAGVDQNWAVSTARNTEVVSDPTNVLALEAAARRRERMRTGPKSAAAVHLAAAHRVVRAQRFSGPHQVAHFHLLSLVSAGRDAGSRRFEAESLQAHIRYYLRALRAFLGDDVPLSLRVTAFDPAVGEDFLETALLAPVREAFPAVDGGVDAARTSGRGYYTALAFHVRAQTPAGEWVQMADGGDVDWTQKLLSNAKERLVISGLGGERLCTLFGQNGGASSTQ